jgi:Transglutaminase-like superfamily
MHALCCTGSVNRKPQAVLRICLALIAALTLTWAPASSAQTPANAANLTLEQLRNDSSLTPERFGRYFRDFEFKLGQDRQAPRDFLAARSGDCDDFACLAAEVLREKKYTTRLVAVFMKGQTHVVCYVDEVHGYLDYNLRKEASAVQPATAKLEDIAGKVAAYFRNRWLSASEFTYEGNQPVFGRIAFAGPAEAAEPPTQHVLRGSTAEDRPASTVQQRTPRPVASQVAAAPAAPHL